MALRVRAKTVDEITGAVRDARQDAALKAPPTPVDVVGMAATVPARSRIDLRRVYCRGRRRASRNHGNRALSSRSGSADVLLSLGVKIDIHRRASRPLRRRDRNRPCPANAIA